MRKLLYGITLGLLATSCAPISTQPISLERTDNPVGFIRYRQSTQTAYADTMTCRLTKYSFLDEPLRLESTQTAD